MTELDIESRLKKLESLLIKKYGDNYYGINSNNNLESINYISTGCYSLDKILGGGLPEGRIVQLYGPESSGKSLISSQLIKSFQHQEKLTALIDTEAAFDPAFASMCGVDINQMMLFKPNDAEEGLEALRDLVKSEIVKLVVLDSIPGLVPREVKEKGVDENTMALLARQLSKVLPDIANIADKNKCTVVIVNQTRATMKMYGPSQAPAGGNALKYASSVILRISKQILKVNGKELGIISTLKAEKNKCTIPYQVAELDILFPHTSEDGTVIAGIDTTKDLIRHAISKDIITKKGGWYEYQSLKVQGEEGLKIELEKDKKLLQQLSQEINNEEER